MKCFRFLCVGAVALAFLADSVAAQSDGGPRKGGPPRDRRRGEEGGRRGRRPSAPPLLRALDTDKNGEISAKEIENAVAALKTLDKNKDGKLVREELRPSEGFGHRGFGRRGDRGHGRRGGRGFGGRGRGRRGGDGFRGRSFGGRGRHGHGGHGISRIMENDKNKDGKISKEEATERLLKFFDRIDANKDGFAEKKELEAMRRRGHGRRGGRGDGDSGKDFPKGKRRPESEE